MSLWQPWSLRGLVEDLRAGRTDPGVAFERSLARIAGTEPEVQAWVELTDTNPVPLSGPLSAVPMGVKDIIDVSGHPTRCGSILRADAAPAASDASIVTAWRSTGALPIGKTVSTEFAFFAPGPTRNPAALNHTPGGSSSGSAAAVASGQVPLALGSQTAGSVTRPAAFCGVAALVMTHGRFPLDGIVGLAESFDSHGLFAATTSDLALAWSALSGERDAGIDPTPASTVLVWEGFEEVEPSMQRAVQAGADRLSALGMAVRPFPLPEVAREVARLHPIVMAAEAAIERAEELAQVDRLSRPLADLLRRGAATSEAEADDARGAIATARARIIECIGDAVVLGPAAFGPAPAGLASTGDPLLSRPWQALGLPQVTVPGMRDAGGLPLGLQVIAVPGSETAALSTGILLDGTRGAAQNAH